MIRRVPSIRVAALVLVLCWIGAGTASADPVTTDTYRTRLREARSLVLSARAAAAAQRLVLVGRAAVLLRSTDAVTLADGSTLAIADAALATRLGPGDDDALARAIADLDLRIAMVDRASSTGLTGAAVDERAREVVRARPATRPSDPSLIDLFQVLVGQVVSFLARGTLSAVDPVFVVAAAAGLGLAIALLVLGTLGGGVRERIRREGLGRDVRVGPVEDPGVYLRRADAAIAAGRVREGLHELYLFALATLAARETIRFDPALTDRELLAHAAAIPEIGSLRALVALHERVWFGLKPADDADAVRARELAQQVAA